MNSRRLIESREIAFGVTDSGAALGCSRPRGYEDFAGDAQLAGLPLVERYCANPRDGRGLERRGQADIREDPAMRKWRTVGISFEHMHMGHLLRESYEHP